MQKFTKMFLGIMVLALLFSSLSSAEIKAVVHGFLKDGVTFTSIDYPGATETRVYGINNAGRIVGYYVDSSKSVHGFLKDGAIFTSFDYPALLSSLGPLINDAGQVVGYYVDGSGDIRAFLTDGATFTSVDYPGASYTYASGINNAGQIVGWYTDSSGWSHGFLKDGATFTSIDYPGADYSYATDINNAGQIVGRYSDSSGAGHGFLKDGASFTSFDYLDSTDSSFDLINNAGQILGSYLDSSGSLHYFMKGGDTITSIDYPGAEYTYAAGINNAGQVVGRYFDTYGFGHGFLKDGATFTSVDYPDAIETRITGINDAGQVVGFYGMPSGQFVPMMRFDTCGGDLVINDFLYDKASNVMTKVKDDCMKSNMFESLNVAQTKIVYAAVDDRVNNHGYINVYDVDSKTTATVYDTEHADFDAAYFDKNNQIIFNDGGTLKRMDMDGSNMTTLVEPLPPYSFGMFWLSPDRKRIIVVESRTQGDDYETGHYERLIMMNADGTDPKTIGEEYLGEWNELAWKSDSKKIFYYHHTFKVVEGKFQGRTPHYFLIDLSGDTPSITDLSNLDGWKDREENVCFFTKSGNLLSLSYKELYNGQTGVLISARPEVPTMAKAMFGIHSSGDIYFADRDGANFRMFVEFNHTLTLNTTGKGSVTSSPSGIKCGGTCSASFPEETVVTLTATAPRGSVFTSWSGCDSLSGTDCRVTMSAPKSVTASFSLSYKLMVSRVKKNKGDGTVSSSDGKIACGTDCSESYPVNTPVTLSATPASGSVFAGWSPATLCTGAGDCTVTMDKAKTVKATFVGPQTLTVKKASVKKGTGTVTSSPGGINCGTTCKANFTYNSSVVLTATPDDGSVFAGWSPATLCTGTGDCTVTMDKAKGVTARFTK